VTACAPRDSGALLGVEWSKIAARGLPVARHGEMSVGAALRRSHSDLEQAAGKRTRPRMCDI